MRYVIIGASAAGINAAKTLRVLDSQSEITIISKDKEVYSRCMLHLLMSGERDIQGISFIDEDFFEKNRINWLNGIEVKLINEDTKTLLLDNGAAVSYDKLLIASGASASIPPIKNLKEASNVFSLRNIEDAISICKNCSYGDDIVIIGAGLVGIDAAVGLINKNIHVNLIEMADRILPLQLDKKASSKYEILLEQKNVTLHLNSSAKEIIINENGEAVGVVLSDGKLIPCKLIIVAAGVRPNIDFIKGSTIKFEKGILIDDYCQTNVEYIFAAGDVTALSPIWPVAVRQGRIAALNMTGIKARCEDTFAYLNSMNFLGLQTISLGITEAPDNSYETYIFESKNIYKKFIYKDGTIYGAILQGDLSYSGVITYLIKNKVNISHVNKNIMKINFADFYSIKENGEYAYALRA